MSDFLILIEHLRCRHALLRPYLVANMVWSKESSVLTSPRMYIIRMCDIIDRIFCYVTVVDWFQISYRWNFNYMPKWLSGDFWVGALSYRLSEKALGGVNLHWVLTKNQVNISRPKVFERQKFGWLFSKKYCKNTLVFLCWIFLIIF